MKVFISQPMRGKIDTEITKERNKTISTAKELYGENIEVIDSFFQSAPTDAKPLWFLGKSLELLSGADIAVFCPGWEDARGCRIEHDCCVEYGIECLHLRYIGIKHLNGCFYYTQNTERSDKMSDDLFTLDLS